MQKLYGRNKALSRKHNVELAVSKALSVFSVEEPLSGAEYADKFFYLSPESSSIKGKWVSYPYQIGPLDFMGFDDIQVVNFKKCARVGYTKMFLSDTCYKIEHKRRKVVTFQPTDTDAKEFVADEVDPAIRDVPSVGELLKCDPEKRSKFNTNTRKQFSNGSVLYIRGAKSPTNFRRLTADQVNYDELDGMDPNVGNEGSPLKLGDARTTTSPFRKSIRGTTPKLKINSLIEKEFQRSDMKLRRWLKCPHCGEFFYLDKKVFDVESPARVEIAMFHCQVCGGGVTYDQYPDLDISGRWQDDDGNYYDEELKLFISHTGEIMRPPLSLGIEIWEAYSYHTSWEKLFAMWNIAVDEFATGAASELQTFVNVSLGEPYEKKGIRVKADGVLSRLEEYQEIIPNKVLYITMAVDVQKGHARQDYRDARLEFEIVGWGIGEESWSLDYGKIFGNPELPHVWEKLDKTIVRKFVREDGATMQISRVGVDCGYSQETVLAYTRFREKRGVVAVKGDGGLLRSFVSGVSMIGPRKDCKCYVLGTNRGKDLVYSRLNLERHGHGYCHFPEGYPPEYYDGLFSEQKIIDKKNPKRFKYEVIQNGAPNEPLDVRVYNQALIKIANPNFEALKKRIEDYVQRKAVNPETATPKPGKRRVQHSEGIKI
jgi:phage terminase large subunit GpA-like protein